MSDQEKQYARVHEYLGPGLLFAASSVGVSHIIQSTRAGATFGLSLVLVAVLVNVFKFAPLSFGSKYTLATGVSLLQGYRNRSRVAIVGFSIVVVLLAMVTVPAIAFITVAATKTAISLEASPTLVSAVLLGSCTLLVTVGGYRALEKVVRILVAIFSVLTVVATVAAMRDISIPLADVVFWPKDVTTAQYLFIIAFLGWMPTTMDASVWQSQWALEKYAGRRNLVDKRIVAREFLAGYIGTVVLAVCFIILGYSIALKTGEPLSSSASVFVDQILEVYANAIGSWSVPLVAVCVISVLFSTLLTIVDAYPRTIVLSIQRWTSDEVPDCNSTQTYAPVFRVIVVALCVYSCIVVTLFGGSFATLIDIATTVSFLLAPLIALLNHLAITGSEVPTKHRPGRALGTLSILNIAVLVVLAGGYIAVVIL